jgi:hypothetical protein
MINLNLLYRDVRLALLAEFEDFWAVASESLEFLGNISGHGLLRRILYPKRNLAHGVFSQGGNGQAGVNARVGGYDRAVYHVQAGVTVHLAVSPTTPSLAS